ncbi:1,6-anhydro-N-acetylmuramyl-L-alanine amidase AmpD [Alkalimarinus alittae]|uniref:1,6-anhydro-N-acetylmuramyl-L-alanine amidase AmpD n=1 Tax=Alkalimarinus alittae TaxID=2961619 RepID=A0ABY6MYT0_9ALTE|nr:1,6-anhydro-N-acetylmuramyl-L-alanine amidase AmpD [Alkalimarinus alittae]UZE94993.1 1,6-anhydro-N-acetylmuramyl-L-alanine amidase AmpD [Alkalimarinus alittae]
MIYNGIQRITHVSNDGVLDGWLKGVRRVVSPNCNARPADAEINLLVIHNISLPPGRYGGDHIERFFTNRLDHSLHPFYKEIEGVEVSSHLLIKRTGEVVQFVPFSERAWHAGASTFQTQENCNDFSIGIELEGEDEVPYTDAQYEVLVKITRCLMREYPGIDMGRIVGHQDIAPGRKTDPGRAFDWANYFGLVGGNASLDAKVV